MVKVTWLPLPCVLENALDFISSVPRLIHVKGLGHLLLLSYPVYYACLLLFCCLNQKPINIYLSVCATLSLSSFTCQYHLLLAGIDIFIYRQATIDPLDLWVIKNHLLARLPGSVALLVSEAGKETFILCCCFLFCCCYPQSLCTPLLLVRCW